MFKIRLDYSATTLEAAKYGYTPTNRLGFYECDGIEVDLSATHVDWVGIVIVRVLTAKLKENGNVQVLEESQLPPVGATPGELA